VNINLIRWIKDFNLFQGLIINSYKVESSKKIAINLTEVPQVNNSDKVNSDNYYFEVKNPTTKLEEILISYNIFSVKNIKSFPFIKIDGFNDKDHKNYFIHLVVKCEQYEILVNKDCIEPSEDFINAIEKSLNDMRPFNALQDVFNEYGHLFPLRIILGKSLKNILTTTHFETFEKINLKLPILESLEPYLNKLKISHFITQKGNVIEKNDLPNWIENTNNDLEIIEYDEMISLCDLLEPEQKRKIDIVLNNHQDSLKIIMTGITDLKDLDDNNMEYHKRINIEPSLENENYEVFGSIVTRNNVKIKDYFIKFGFYDVNGFSAIIKKTLKKSGFNIKDCSILWMIVGNPLKLSVFSPNNREIQVDRIEASRVDKSNYYCIKTSFPLSQGYGILINASTNCNIKLVEWSYNYIKFEIVESIYNKPNSSSGTIFDSDSDSQCEEENETIIIDVDLRVCILRSDYGSLKIDKIDRVDHVEMKYLLDLFGYILTKENSNNESFNEINKFDDIKDIIKQPFIDDDTRSALLKGFFF